MQTFLPYSDFKTTAKCLDMRRLGKQRVECLQILKSLSEPNYGWKNHPAVKMWKGSEIYLIKYAISICDEWLSRGYKDTCLQKILPYYERHYKNNKQPFWYGDERLYSSHRAALLYKSTAWYSQFGWKEEPRLNYFWPK